MNEKERAFESEQIERKRKKETELFCSSQPKARKRESFLSNKSEKVVKERKQKGKKLRREVRCIFSELCFGSDRFIFFS